MQYCTGMCLHAQMSGAHSNLSVRTQGAMYTFPQIHLPSKAIAKAESLKMQPDTYYCMRVLEATGVVRVSSYTSLPFLFVDALLRS